MVFTRSREAGFSLIELSLAIAIGLAILSASFWMVKQHNAEARIQQSKMMLATIRTQLATYRYRYGAYPTLQEMQRNWATPSANQFQIVPGASRSAAELVTNDGGFNEPVSGVCSVRTATATYNGGWIYDPALGTIRVNLDPAAHPGDNPLLW